jgi:hypothetical protein
MRSVWALLPGEVCPADGYSVIVIRQMSNNLIKR